MFRYLILNKNKLNLVKLILLFKIKKILVHFLFQIYYSLRCLFKIKAMDLFSNNRIIHIWVLSQMKIQTLNLKFSMNKFLKIKNKIILCLLYQLIIRLNHTLTNLNPTILWNKMVSIQKYLKIIDQNMLCKHRYLQMKKAIFYKWIQNLELV